MKKFTKIVAGVAALTLAAGLAVGAAGSLSSTTSNTVIVSETGTEEYQIGTDTTQDVTVTTDEGTQVRVNADLSQTTKPVIATINVADTPTAKALASTATATAAAEGKKVLVSAATISVRNAEGHALASDYGTAGVVVKIGTEYTSVTVLIAHADGTVETVVLPVVDGQIVIETTESEITFSIIA